MYRPKLLANRRLRRAFRSGRYLLAAYYVERHQFRLGCRKLEVSLGLRAE